jgi:excisionase family DNA binding protein
MFMSHASNDRAHKGKSGGKPKKPGVVGYKVEEVAELLRISRNAAYDLVARKEIPSIRVGRLLRVPVGPFHEKFGNVIAA